MKTPFFKKSIPTFIFIVIFSIAGMILFYSLLRVDEKLPIYNPADVNPRLVDPSVRYIRKNHKIANFKLINQNGDTITNKNYKGKIYVADFFFSRCKSICLPMALHMGELQKYYKKDSEVMFLSHSVTPVADSVPVLKKYAREKGAIAGKWNITTGDKKEIYSLARKSYFAVLDEGDGGPDDFIHTENFVLVDKKGQVRGTYDGTSQKEIKKIIRDISVLKKEYQKK